MCGECHQEQYGDWQDGSHLTVTCEVCPHHFVLTDDEMDTLQTLLRARFALDDEETAMVLQTGLERAEHAVSLHEFTRLLHETPEPRC